MTRINYWSSNGYYGALALKRAMEADPAWRARLDTVASEPPKWWKPHPDDPPIAGWVEIPWEPK